MKKIIALFSFLALTFSLSGCMSAEEKMKAEEDERLAVPIGVRKDNVYKISGGSAKYGDYRKIDMSKLYDNQPFTVGIYEKDK